MAKTSGEFEKEFIEFVKERTGKSVEQWIPIIKKTGLSKQMEITNWLKTQDLNHMQASLLAGLYLNNGKPVYQNEDGLLENQFLKCADIRPLFDKISSKLLSHFPDARLIPKKTYLSYGYEFSNGIHPYQLKLNITGYNPYFSLWDTFWQGSFTWDQKTKKVIYQSIGTNGSVATGASEIISQNLLGLVFSILNVSGITEWHKDIHTIENDQLVSTSYLKSKKKWNVSQSMTWTRLEQPDGTIAYMTTRDGNFELYSMTADGENLINLTCNKAVDYAFTQGPDGKIVFYSNRDGNDEVYIMDKDGKNQINISNHPAADRVTAISPDGKKIVFSSNRDHKSGELYLMNMDGSEVTRLTTNDNFEDAPSWSPDGKQIIFSRDIKASSDTTTSVLSNGEIFIMNADGSNQKRLTFKSGFDGGPGFSPDGKKIAFYGPTPDKNYEIFIMNADGTSIENLTDDKMEDYSPAWSPDGKWIAYTKGNSKNYDVWLIHLDTKIKYRLTSQPKRDESPFWINKN